MHSNKQPKSLAFLFLTELWERFAYFSIMSLLVLMMTKTFNFSDAKSYAIFSAFGALLFITPVIGGFVADRIIGNVHAIILGAILLGGGYFTLALGKENIFLIALAIIICGNGFFKPNISGLLGSLYEKNDPRRETGFTMFYVCINIGATIGVILCGFAAKIWGFNAAFALSATALFIGLGVFLLGLKTIKKDITLKNRKPHNFAKLKTICVYFGILVIVITIFCTMQHPSLANLVLEFSALLIFGYLFWEVKKCQGEERKNFLICIILIIFSVAFWALYQQTPMSLTMYIARSVNLNLFGLTLPPSVIGSLNGISLVILTPIVIKFWKILRAKNKELSVATKFALGIIFMSLGYFILALSAFGVTNANKASLISVVISFALQTLGEIFLSPVGLSMVTVLAPEKLRSMMLGVWFFALALATAIAGQLAKFANIANPNETLIEIAKTYGHAFFIYGSLALIIGIILFGIRNKLQ